MPDLFDEFMKELERRRAEAERAEAEARSPRRPGDPSPGDTERDRAKDADADMTDDRTDADDQAGTDADDQAGTDAGDEPADADDRAGTEAEDGDADTDRDAPEPTPIRRRGAAGAPPRGPKERKPAGGPDDGATGPTVGGVLRRMGLAAVFAAIVLVVLVGGIIVDLATDAIWYESVGFDSVFWTRLRAQVGLFGIAAVVAAIVLLGNLWLASRLAPPPDPEKPGRIRTWTERISESQRRADLNARMSGGPARGPFGGPFGAPGGPGGREEAAFSFDVGDLPDLTPVAGWILGGFALLVALGVAGAVSGAWETLLLWSNRVAFSPDASVTDPVFARDISFFLFELPFFREVQAIVNGLLLAALAIAVARYLVAATRGGEVFITRVRVHLAVLGGLYLLSVAFGYQLDKFELVYSGQGVATGVAFTDANARFLAYDVLTILSGLAGALLVAGAFTRWMWPLGVIVGVWFAASIVLGRLYPEVVQRFSVDPNTFAQEERYIANNIAMTRLAFGIDDWESQPYGGTAPLTREAIQSEKDTFTNARLWDYRPLQATLDQLQTVRQYYDFVDVDTDRYVVGGELRQVMLSARELAIERNPEATSWVNQRIIYTHGIGIAMVPVNEVTLEGQPRLWVRDLPPISIEGVPAVNEPRIYFGEADNHYIVVGARQAEFDFPRDMATGSTEERTSWTGQTGIRLDSTLPRLLFALRFRDLDLLISDQIQAQSQLLFNRTLDERLGRIAPFLRYDKDPYVVVDDDGHLVYVQDAYTVSDRFPHATWFNPGELGAGTGLGGRPLNYLRNSVKITMDAYDGTMRFYVADPSDPLIRAWQGVFPGLFESIDGLPDGLRPHLRVPEELFNVQTRVYGRYHVNDPLVFFSNNDRWTIPDPQANEQSLPTEAYYVVMRMPGEPKAEFLLLQPMIAANRPNMIAWVAARNDAPNLGVTRVYQFPADTTIFGPAQIEARIDQDPVISAQITLWNQSGSRVIRGNLIVVPVGDSLIYLQPVYLQSTSAAFPEFQKIVVASPTTVVWADGLEAALTGLLDRQGGVPGASPTPGPGVTPTPGPGASPTPRPTTPPGAGLPEDVAGLIDYANVHFEAAQVALRAGDFATYGEEMDLVEAALQRLSELSASPGA